MTCLYPDLKNASLKESTILVSVQDLINKHPGSWTFTFGGRLVNFKIKNGQIRHGGKPINLKHSTNPAYPTNGGWMKFDADQMTYYIRFSPFKVVATRDGVKVSGGASKEIPANGMYQATASLT